MELFTVKDGQLKGRKKAVPIREIKDIYWGSSSFRYITVRTLTNKKINLSTYNLVPEEPINHVIETYVIPQVNMELKKRKPR